MGEEEAAEEGGAGIAGMGEAEGDAEGTGRAKGIGEAVVTAGGMLGVESEMGGMVEMEGEAGGMGGALTEGTEASVVEEGGLRGAEEEEGVATEGVAEERMEEEGAEEWVEEVEEGTGGIGVINRGGLMTFFLLAKYFCSVPSSTNFSPQDRNSLRSSGEGCSNSRSLMLASFVASK